MTVLDFKNTKPKSFKGVVWDGKSYTGKMHWTYIEPEAKLILPRKMVNKILKLFPRYATMKVNIENSLLEIKWDRGDYLFHLIKCERIQS